MRTSATGRMIAKSSSERRRGSRSLRGWRSLRGFSLLELLIVVMIIGLGAAIVGISVGNDQPQELRNDARDFANLTGLVEEEAILSREQWGVQIYREGAAGEDYIAYRWLHFIGGKTGWKPEAPRDLPDGGRFPDHVIAVLELEGEEQLIEPLPRDKPIEPTVWLAPGGDVTPFVLRLYFEGSNGGAVVRSDALGRIALELPKDES
jgi:general secretion pathway protein H